MNKEIYQCCLSGEIITDDIIDIREFPLPNDNWYTREIEKNIITDSLRSVYFGSSDFSLFALIDDKGQEESRWIPVVKVNNAMDEIHADGLPVSIETEGPNPEDLEWNVVFENFHRVDTEAQEDGKIVVGQEYYVDFSCPGCGHRHEKINFVGWTAIKCLGCSATLNREERGSSNFGYHGLKMINQFWSMALYWIVTNRPSWKISGREEARKICHRYRASIEEFATDLEFDLTEENVSRYLGSRL